VEQVVRRANEVIAALQMEIDEKVVEVGAGRSIK
jgi:hypothetical protein